MASTILGESIARNKESRAKGSRGSQRRPTKVDKDELNKLEAFDTLNGIEEEGENYNDDQEDNFGNDHGGLGNNKSLISEFTENVG